MEKSVDEINEKIQHNKAKVLTAIEAKQLIKEKGIKYFLSNIDVVTFSSFEMNTNALLYLNFGQTDPLIYFQEAYVNDVLAYPLGPSDLALSVVAESKSNLEYGGAHVISDLVAGKEVLLKVVGKGLEVYPNKEFETWFNLSNVNLSKLLLNQGVNQNNIVATNSGNKDINSNMGTLISKLENSTYNSSSYLNPLINDPFCRTIGVGTKIWVGGGAGYVTGHGSNHNPRQKRNEYGIPIGPSITLSVIADISLMKPKWVRGGYLKSFGPVIYIGIGFPIPILNEEIASNITISDDKIHTTIVDFSIPRRAKPTFGQCTYQELRSTTVVINKKPTLAAPLSSMAYAVEICNLLKEEILEKRFFLTDLVEPIKMDNELKKLGSRLPEMV